MHESHVSFTSNVPCTTGYRGIPFLLTLTGDAIQVSDGEVLLNVLRCQLTY